MHVIVGCCVFTKIQVTQYSYHLFSFSVLCSEISLSLNKAAKYLYIMLISYCIKIEKYISCSIFTNITRLAVRFYFIDYFID